MSIMTLPPFKGTTEEEIAAFSAKYPVMSQYFTDMGYNETPTVGRDKEMIDLRSIMARPVYRNSIIIGEAGVGKTTLVKEMRSVDPGGYYFELNFNDFPKGEMAINISALTREIMMWNIEDRPEGTHLVIFTDEFHVIMMAEDSKQAVENLKPILATAGQFGLSWIGATTQAEFNQYLKDNEPLLQRMSPYTLDSLDKRNTVAALENFVKKNFQDDSFLDKTFYELIYDLSTTHLEREAQPRTSLRILDAALGVSAVTDAAFNADIIWTVMRTFYGIDKPTASNIDWIEEQLNQLVLGQPAAVRAVCDSLHIVASGLDQKPNRPRNVSLFMGPTGTGKTYLASQVARLLFGGARDNYKVINMTEYSTPGSVDDLRFVLTDHAFNRPASVYLLDEIEKAHPECSRLLMRVFDEGLLADRQGRNISFKSAYFFVTTNESDELLGTIEHSIKAEDIDANAKAEAAKALAEYKARASEEELELLNSGLRYEAEVIEGELVDQKQDTSGSRFYSISELHGAIYDALRESEHFPDEILGRLDNLVIFSPLKDTEMRRITKGYFHSMALDMANQHGLVLGVHPRVVTYLHDLKAQRSTGDGGARDNYRTFRNEILAKIARFVNAQAKNGYPHMFVGITFNGTLRSENKTLSMSRGAIQIGAYDNQHDMEYDQIMLTSQL